MNFAFPIPIDSRISDLRTSLARLINSGEIVDSVYVAPIDRILGAVNHTVDTIATDMSNIDISLIRSLSVENKRSGSVSEMFGRYRKEDVQGDDGYRIRLLYGLNSIGEYEVVFYDKEITIVIRRQ